MDFLLLFELIQNYQWREHFLQAQTQFKELLYVYVVMEFIIFLIFRMLSLSELKIFPLPVCENVLKGFYNFLYKVMSYKTHVVVFVKVENCSISIESIIYQQIAF